MYETFWTRMGNHPFNLDVRTLSDYETHFTVMNYGYQYIDVPNGPEYALQFDQTYNGIITWKEMHRRICLTIKEVLLAAQTQYPAMANFRSRAVYGIDVMITEDFVPKILEFTYSPDCKRACVSNPTFYNDLFECLFYGKVHNMTLIP
jgi:tubulin--tyrosine ligase-like protein 12